MQVVGDVADQRIENRVDDQRDHDAEPDVRLGKAEHLVVVEQQEEREAVVLHAERHRPEAVEKLRPQVQGLSAHENGLV